jgi:hypothetical protein
MLRYLLVVLVLIKACFPVQSQSGHLLTKVMCSRTSIQQIEARETIQILKRCIYQKRQQQNQLRTIRSIELQQPEKQLTEFESKIMDEFKKIANAPFVLNAKKVNVQVTQIDLKPRSSNRIQCDGTKVIRVESATLTSKNYENKCEQIVENDNLLVLNQTCHNQVQTLQIASDL